MTDEFGIAVLKTQFPTRRLRGHEESLVVRVKGCPLECSRKFETRQAHLRIERLGWKWLHRENDFRKMGLGFRIQAVAIGDEYRW